MGHRARSQAIVAIGVVGVALWAVSGLMVPLAFAVFAVFALEPLRARLHTKLPSWLAVLVSLLVALAVFGALVSAIVLSFVPVHDDWGRYETQLEVWHQTLEDGAKSMGISLGDGGGELGKSIAKSAAAFVSGFGLTVGFFILGAAEVVDLRAALERATSPDTCRRIATAIERTAHDVRIYLVVRTIVGLITGALVVVAAYAVGLELPWTWGVLNFLLNYIPTVGSVLAVVPPVLFGQATGGWSHALWALVAVGGVQLVMGVVFDPLLQGKGLAISPLAVLVSVTLWGIVWGIPGAFVATPMTMLIMRLCQAFEPSHWLYDLLVRGEDEA